jgi:hypothetical protein
MRPKGLLVTNGLLFTKGKLFTREFLVTGGTLPSFEASRTAAMGLYPPLLCVIFLRKDI